MADTPGRISVGELHLTFPHVEATDEIISAAADRLALYAREVANESLHGTYEVVVTVSEGSLKEDVSLFISIAALGVTLVTADYGAARRNISWLMNQAESFTETIAQSETRRSQLPVATGDVDRSIVVRKRTPVLDGLRELLDAAEEVTAQRSSKARRAKLVEEVARVLRLCESNEERRELLSYLSADSNVDFSLREELGENYKEEIVRRRRVKPSQDKQLRLEMDEEEVVPKLPKPRVRRKLKKAVRRFTVTAPEEPL